MKVSKEDKKEFFRRKKVLEETTIELKKEFVGLDGIIDEVIDLIEAWYLFPNGQIRPTIVNLWGMTGVGKTSLIKRMFELLDLKDNLYKFDVGDYASQDNTKLSYSFSEKLKNREKQQIGIIFDEFQLGRTIDEHGHELEKSGLRAMWDLLDSGKISILQSSYYGSKVYQLTLKLEDCVQNGDVEAKNGKVTKNKEYHEKYFKADDNNGDLNKPSASTKKKKKKKKGDDELLNADNDSCSMFIPEQFYWYIQIIWDNRFLTERELKEHLKNMGHNESIEFLNDTLQRAFKPMEFDYSNSCIFVIGNIDEAYRMDKNFDPDSDADRFYKHSLNITLPHIKSALGKRFRAEQIARLGNSHIIYPAFSSKVYKELIALELQKKKELVQKRFNLDIEFDKSIGAIIYKEGVFPTQGARPVFTTVNALIEAYVGKIIKDILEVGKKIKSIKWKFSRNKYYVQFLDKDGNIVMKKYYPVRLKIENLRKSDGSEMQAHVAVHEAGHAIASIYGANLLPTEIVSRTANMSEGHCAIDLPKIDTKELLEKDIIITLGGYCAEKLVFGEDNLSDGTGSDFERVSAIALEMSKVYGMTSTPMLFGQKSSNSNTYWNSSKVDEMDDLAEKIVIECEKQCMKIIEDNMYLLLKIADFLSTKSRMDSKSIIKFIESYGKEVEIIDKNDYHSFKDTLAKKLEEAKNKLPKSKKSSAGGKKNSSESVVMNSKKKDKDDKA